MKKLLLLFSLLAATTLRASAQNEIVDYFEIFEVYANGINGISSSQNLVGPLLKNNTAMLWITKEDGEHTFVVLTPSEDAPEDSSKDIIYAFCIVNEINRPLESLNVHFDDDSPKFAADGRIFSPILPPNLKPSFILFEKLTPPPHLNDGTTHCCLSIYCELDKTTRKWSGIQFYGRAKEYNHTIP